MSNNFRNGVNRISKYAPSRLSFIFKTLDFLVIKELRENTDAIAQKLKQLIKSLQVLK